MKKILFLLLSTIAMYGQVPADATPLENIQITNNKTSTTATKVNVQENDGTINTISKSDLVNVVEVNDVPSLPLIGEVGKIYVVKNLNKIYRWNSTFYQGLTTDISGKEDIANKQNSLAVDGTNTKYPTVTAVNTGLALKANLASPTFTGAPTAPTPTITTGIANKSYVDGLDNGNVKLTGNQTIAGEKTFTNNIVLNGGVLTFLGMSSLQTGNPSIYRIGNRLALNVAPGGKNVILDGNEIASSITLNLQNSSGTLALTSNPTSLTAASFIKSSAPTTNILLAGGGDIAQNTAFNKNFGTTAGTVVEGGTLGSNAYTSTAYLPLSGGTVTGNFKLNGLLLSDNFTGMNPQVLNPTATVLFLGNTSLTNINYESGTRHQFFIGSSAKGTFNSTGLFVDGTVTASGGFFNSDRRLKNIFKRDGDVAYYTWKDGRDTKEHIGYVAQEVQEKHPNQVQADEKGMLSVNYVEILVEKIRILEKRIEQLEKSK